MWSQYDHEICLRSRIVPFPDNFKETLVLFVNAERASGGEFPI